MFRSFIKGALILVVAIVAYSAFTGLFAQVYWWMAP